MKQRLLKILENFKNKKILVIGDIMLDKYIWGDVSRISPEAPVQVVNVSKETYAPGGASNVASNASALNGKVYMAGIAGNDEAKNILIRELKGMGVNTDGIIIDADKPTTQKVRIVGRSQQLLRVDYEKKDNIHQNIEKDMVKFLENAIKDVDVVVISDYAKGVINQAVCGRLIEMARSSNKPVIVDPKPKHRDLYSNATLITPNNAEASEMTGIEDGSDDAVLEMGPKLMKYLNSNVLITRGEKGMSLFEKDGKVVHIPAKAKEVYSLIGAGDTVVAAIALALASGASLEEAAVIANIAAGIKVGKIGTASVSIEEIKRGIEEL
ncbi:D-glycero-beta-D-manno-heptose-7-phosphate kinase [Candidatus Woesearchaeota archaeon]|nr:D-glycero-beta-D-manno-heptose-7-phosphate kinase [Candidatus Woesearchaeota archaeon]